MSRECYGIDFGTTYSCIAVVNEEGMVDVIANAKGHKEEKYVHHHKEEKYVHIY